MAEYKFCWIPAGGADARRAGQRRLKLDIEQTWDHEGAGRCYVGGRLHELNQVHLDSAEKRARRLVQQALMVAQDRVQTEPDQDGRA
ncbi:hypothetical protein V1524DRAFT_437044 [Lipomyces starkeyi]